LKLHIIDPCLAPLPAVQVEQLSADSARIALPRLWLERLRRRRRDFGIHDPLVPRCR
jgi:hypothetical protein